MFWNGLMLMYDNQLNEDGRQYLQMMWATIERMAANSANCKTWMVTIVSAFMALQCSIQSLNGWVLFGLLPIILLWYLDAMYLKLERGFRNRERDYLNNINAAAGDNAKAKVPVYDLTVLNKDKDDKEKGFKSTKGVWYSKSVIWFYLIPLLVVIFLSWLLNSDIISSFISK